MKAIRKLDLKDQTGTRGPRPFFLCPKCGNEYSANRGDYFNVPDNHVFKCCGVNSRLVTARRVFDEFIERADMPQ